MRSKRKPFKMSNKVPWQWNERKRCNKNKAPNVWCIRSFIQRTSTEDESFDGWVGQYQLIQHFESKSISRHQSIFDND